MKKLISFLTFVIFYNFSNAQISYSIVISALPTCSTCCDGQAYVTLPSGGACAGVYSYSCTNGQDGPTSTFTGLCWNTTYTVTVYTPCDTTRKTFTMPPYTGIFEYHQNLNFNFYPNPTTTSINFDFYLHNSRIIIYSSTGQIIYESIFQKTIDVSDFPIGLYWIKIISKEQNYNCKKFIRE